MKPSAYYDRVVDVMEELVKFTLMVRERSEYLVDRYSERKGAVEVAALAAAAGVVEHLSSNEESTWKRSSITIPSVVRHAIRSR